MTCSRSLSDQVQRWVEKSESMGEIIIAVPPGATILWLPTRCPGLGKPSRMGTEEG